MTAFLEEQKNELEAVEAIFCNEIKVISEATPIQYTICIRSETCGEDKEDELQVTFTYTEKYPEEAPDIQVTLCCDFCDENDEKELLSLLTNEANNSLGSVMVLTLVSCATEWLNSKKDEQTARMKSEMERTKREAEEAEMKKFEGTRVTVESFLRWKQEFEREMSESITKQFIEVANKKLTGKELFEKDDTLNESDLSFLNEECDEFDDSVAVDESLFQDLDELDINDFNNS